jgi:adenylate kinase family enzyme
MPAASPIGRRVQIMGQTSAGKSTLAAHLAGRLGVPFVELDALFWKPGWVESDREEFRGRVVEATRGDGWVVAGNYRRETIPAFWDRLETVIWLDFPLPIILWRVLRRSWRRSRTRELLWGTNHERFWGQLQLWSQSSLLHFAVRYHRRRRREFAALMGDPTWSHVRFVRLRSPAQLARFLEEFERALAEASTEG